MLSPLLSFRLSEFRSASELEPLCEYRRSQRRLHMLGSTPNRSLLLNTVVACMVTQWLVLAGSLSSSGTGQWWTSENHGSCQRLFPCLSTITRADTSGNTQTYTRATYEVSSDFASQV